MYISDIFHLIYLIEKNICLFQVCLQPWLSVSWVRANHLQRRSLESWNFTTCLRKWAATGFCFWQIGILLGGIWTWGFVFLYFESCLNLFSRFEQTSLRVCASECAGCKRGLFLGKIQKTRINPYLRKWVTTENLVSKNQPKVSQWI